MEADRAAANIGGIGDIDHDLYKEEKVRQPKKRFIGRKAAAERADRKDDLAGTIEASGAIQGMAVSTPREQSS